MNRAHQRYLAAVTEQMRRANDGGELSAIHVPADDIERLATAGVFASPSAEQRRRWARVGVALPDGSYPIPDCGYAEKAIRAQGRARPEDRGKVVAHIRKRVRALRCSGDIFDKYK